jgi:hypothetical protein
MSKGKFYRNRGMAQKHAHGKRLKKVCGGYKVE